MNAVVFEEDTLRAPAPCGGNKLHLVDMRLEHEGVVIVFECEPCSDNHQLRMFQYKGYTKVEWWVDAPGTFVSRWTEAQQAAFNVVQTLEQELHNARKRLVDLSK